VHALRIFRLPRFRTVYLFRGLATWVGVRLLVAAGGLPRLSALEAGVVLALVVGLVVFDARRRAEDVFLGNLGIPRRGIALAALPLPLLLEVCLR
jgi:hypothetical protein